MSIKVLIKQFCQFAYQLMVCFFPGNDLPVVETLWSEGNECNQRFVCCNRKSLFEPLGQTVWRDCKTVTSNDIHRLPGYGMTIIRRTFWLIEKQRHLMLHCMKWATCLVLKWIKSTIIDRIRSQSIKIDKSRAGWIRTSPSGIINPAPGISPAVLNYLPVFIFYRQNRFYMKNIPALLAFVGNQVTEFLKKD